MGLFDHFPYTNVHELNLDWLLTMMKALEAEWEQFTSGNSLTFADPLQHDITKTYAKNTIVIDGSGNAYVSLQPVPVGVGLQNGDYWLMVFDYEAFIEKVNKNFTARYYRGSYRATSAMAIGDWLTVDDVLCKATAAIAADDILELGVNIERFTLEDFIKAFMTSANQMIQQYKNDIDASELAYRNQLAQDIADITATLQAELDQAISGATVDSEVILARVGADGITYPTLGDAIRGQYNELLDIDEEYLKILFTNFDTINVPANSNVTKIAFAGLSTYLEAGTYYVSCKQDATLTSVTRNVFTAINVDVSPVQQIFDTSDLQHLSSGLLVWKMVIPTSAHWSVGRWINANAEEVNFTNFMIAKVHPNFIDILTRDAGAVIGCIRGYAQQVPVFTKSGTSIVVKLPTILRGWYYSPEGLDNIGNSGTYPDVTVAHGEMLVYDVVNNTFSSISQAQTATAFKTGTKILCFYNSNGEINGDWKCYQMERMISTTYYGTYIDFNGSDEPRIYKQNDTTLYITIPYSMRIVRNDYKSGTGYISDARNSNISDATLSHNQALVFNLNTFQFEIKTGPTFPTNTTDYVICVYNSGGGVKGQWYKYWVHQQLENRGDVPYYWLSHLDTKEAIINGHNIDMAGNGDSFVFVTDIHITSNFKKSPVLVKDIIKNTSIDKIILNGDYIDQETTKESAVAKSNAVVASYADNGFVPTYASIGNHEFNNPGLDPSWTETLTAAEISTSIRTSNKFCVRGNSLAYYFDNDVQKIRYYVGACTAGGGFDSTALAWLMSEIPNTPSGYDIVLISHGGIHGTYSDGHWSNLYPLPEFEPLVDMLDAVKNRTTYTYGGITYDFTSATFDVLFGILGHLHCDTSYTSSGGVLYILCDTDSTILACHTKTKGTNTEQAFDVVQVDRTAGKVYCTRIGAGSDRTFTY